MAQSICASENTSTGLGLLHHPSGGAIFRGGMRSVWHGNKQAIGLPAGSVPQSAVTVHCVLLFGAAQNFCSISTLPPLLASKAAAESNQASKSSLKLPGRSKPPYRPTIP